MTGDEMMIGNCFCGERACGADNRPSHTNLHSKPDLFTVLRDAVSRRKVLNTRKRDRFPSSYAWLIALPALIPKEIEVEFMQPSHSQAPPGVLV